MRVKSIKLSDQHVFVCLIDLAKNNIADFHYLFHLVNQLISLMN